MILDYLGGPIAWALKSRDFLGLEGREMMRQKGIRDSQCEGTQPALTGLEDGESESGTVSVGSF